MAPTYKNVMVIGVSFPLRPCVNKDRTDKIQASGAIGSAIFKAIVKTGKFNVSVLTRPESSNTYAADIKVVKSDYSEASLVESFKGQDVVVSALGAAGLAEEPKIVDACVKAGVKRLLPSEYSCDAQNAKTAALIPIFGIKARVIEQLRAQESEGLSWTAVVSGAAFDLVSCI